MSVDAATKRSASRLAWIAFALSLLTSAGLWMVVASALSGNVGDNQSLWWQQPWASLVAGFTIVAPVLVVASIVLAIVAGRHGGPSRRVSLAGGLLLVTSPLFLIVITLVSNIHSR